MKNTLALLGGCLMMAGMNGVGEAREACPELQDSKNIQLLQEFKDILKAKPRVPGMYSNIKFHKYDELRIDKRDQVEKFIESKNPKITFRGESEGQDPDSPYASDWFYACKYTTDLLGAFELSYTTTYGKAKEKSKAK